jgi:hypothetical protein
MSDAWLPILSLTASGLLSGALLSTALLPTALLTAALLPRLLAAWTGLARRVLIAAALLRTLAALLLVAALPLLIALIRFVLIRIVHCRSSRRVGPCSTQMQMRVQDWCPR